MRGAGTKTAIPTARTFPALLDITRLTSRVGRGAHTGVDRVELAYLKWCLATDPPLWGIAKIASGFVILDREGLKAFHDRISGIIPWGARDMRAIVGVKTPAPRGAAEADLRRLAHYQMRGLSTDKHLRQLGAAGTVYVNTGHSNLSHDTLLGLKEAGLRTAVFLHDLIPFELPEFQRAASVEKFQAKWDAITAHADIILTNSLDSENRIRARLENFDLERTVTHAHLGVNIKGESITEFVLDRPYFVTLGTIEPRKNHAFLLDIWEQFAIDLSPDQMPQLHIVGQRGWVAEDVITRLNDLSDSLYIHEHNRMDDAALWALIAGSHGLLFPSIAEGFGLPSLEAAALGVPVICGDLAIHHELLGDYPVYASLQDIYLWKKTIIEQAGKRLEDLRDACAQNTPHIPTWDEHFDRINGAVMGSL